MKRRKKRIRRFPWQRVCLAVLLVLVLAFIARLVWRASTAALDTVASAGTSSGGAAKTSSVLLDSPASSASSSSSGAESAAGSPSSSSGVSAAAVAPPFPVQVNVTSITDTHFLELVNQTYGIEDVSSSSLVPAYPTVHVRATDITINPTVLDAIKDMFQAATSANAGSFYISSGFRPYAQQTQIYDSETDKSYTQTPGHSEHETGLAADIMADNLSQDELAGSPQGNWLAANSWKYGLILRYPQGKESITGISYESWHFRYIGEPHAYYCYQHQLCLEEYVAFLKSSGGYTVTLDGKDYTIAYETPQNGTIYVPEGQNYNVSDDNTGGYIVTAWA